MKRKGIVKKKSYIRSVIRYSIILFFVLFQLALIGLVVLFFNRYLASLYVLLEIGSIIILFPLLSQERNSANKLFWLGVVLVLPIGGQIMYQLWGREKVNRRSHRIIQQSIDSALKGQIMDGELLVQLKELSCDEGKAARYLMNQGFGLYAGNEVKYFGSGENAFADMEEKLKEAKKYIFLSFFTIADGEIWGRFSRILKERCRDGVRVCILYDDVGSVLRLSDTSVDEMRAAGIEMHSFNPVENRFYSYFFNYRSHQKIMVIDGIYAYTGGINISDRYANISSPYGHWKDSAIRIKGDGVYGMQLIFIGMYNAGKLSIDVKEYPFVPACGKGDYCIPFADGPSNNPENPAFDTYLNVINAAKEEVCIMTPYLVIDDILQEALCLAAKSGIRVRIITPGIPDKKYVKLLTERHYGGLLLSGVEIYEYTPGFVHSKICMNESSVIIGTINLDFRSFFLHYENGVYLPGSSLRGEIAGDFEETVEKSRRISYEEWKRRPWYKKFAQEFLYFFKCQL